MVGFVLLLLGNIYFLIRLNNTESKLDEVRIAKDSLHKYIGNIYRHPEIICDSSLTKDNVLNYIRLKGIRWPNIVWAQCMFETGYLSCDTCCFMYNNLFGFMLNGKCMRFDTWQESIQYYYRWQQKLYKNPKEDYFNFLKRVGYASFPEYNIHVAQILIDNKLQYKKD
ncbi:MAG: glucosaminidase domain-containing protein [Bacteroidetes bacterium]|nr:glucosaminidase domain-containing protein [Bacteroidota bacterium]